MHASLSRRLVIAVAVLSVIAWINVAVAQAPNPNPAQVRPGSQANQWTDHVIEQWLLIDNQGELEVARWGQERTQNKEVREFAKMMIQDHTDFVTSLRQFHEKHSGAASPKFPAQQGGFDVIAFKQELSKQCLASLKEEFSHKEGRAFDVCFMGHQTVCHMQMLDTLKVFQRHASPELAGLIALAIDTTQDHLMHAKKMMKDFEAPAAETARRPAFEK